MTNEHFPPVEIDARPAHPDIVFFQDRETLHTVAVDKDTGAVLGASGRTSLAARVRVVNEVRAYRARMLAHTSAASTRKR